MKSEAEQVAGAGMRDAEDFAATSKHISSREMKGSDKQTCGIHQNDKYADKCLSQVQGNLQLDATLGRRGTHAHDNFNDGMMATKIVEYLHDDPNCRQGQELDKDI